MIGNIPGLNFYNQFVISSTPYCNLYIGHTIYKLKKLLNFVSESLLSVTGFMKLTASCLLIDTISMYIARRHHTQWRGGDFKHIPYIVTIYTGT